jgi:hypothetical protein
MFIEFEPEVMFYWQSRVSFFLPYVGSFPFAHDFHLLETKAQKQVQENSGNFQQPGLKFKN